MLAITCRLIDQLSTTKLFFSRPKKSAGSQLCSSGLPQNGAFDLQTAHFKLVLVSLSYTTKPRQTRPGPRSRLSTTLPTSPGAFATVLNISHRAPRLRTPSPSPHRVAPIVAAPSLRRLFPRLRPTALVCPRSLAPSRSTRPDSIHSRRRLRRGGARGGCSAPYVGGWRRRQRAFCVGKGLAVLGRRRVLDSWRGSVSRFRNRAQQREPRWSPLSPTLCNLSITPAPASAHPLSHRSRPRTDSTWPPLPRPPPAQTPSRPFSARVE